MKQNNLKGSLILVTAALIWGLAFVAQSGAASLVPPFIFNALRSFIGAAALYIFNLFINRKDGMKFFPDKSRIKNIFIKRRLFAEFVWLYLLIFSSLVLPFIPKGLQVKQGQAL